jgi:hypothetical protein
VEARAIEGELLWDLNDRKHRALLRRYLSLHEDHFEYRECGPSFLIVIKLLKLLTTKRGIKGRICFTLVYSEEIFKKASFEELIRSEDITDWEILQGEVLKNGERYESDQTKHFFAQYLRDL